MVVPLGRVCCEASVAFAVFAGTDVTPAIERIVVLLAPAVVFVGVTVSRDGVRLCLSSLPLFCALFPVLFGQQLVNVREDPSVYKPLVPETV